MITKGPDFSSWWMTSFTKGENVQDVRENLVIWAAMVKKWFSLPGSISPEARPLQVPHNVLGKIWVNISWMLGKLGLVVQLVSQMVK